MEALEFRFAFHAHDFEKSIHFYRDILGMKSVGEWWDRPDGKGALLSAGGKVVIEIYGPTEGRAYEGPNPVAVNLALRLEKRSDVDDFHQSLVDRGVACTDPPQERSWGHYSFVVFDPDNIPVHIYCEI